MLEPFLLKINSFNDERGTFYESYKQQSFFEKTGLNINFVQDNHSISKKNVIRGLHYQWNKPMDKLVRCSFGKIMDVVLDIRKMSSNFGKVYYFELSDDNLEQLFVPAGFAHSFIVLSDYAHVQYKCSVEYNKDGESGINPLDKDLNINWGIQQKEAILSNKDKNSISFLEYAKNSKF